MNSIRIIPMATEHLDQVVELDKNSFSLPWDRPSFERELNNPLSDWLVALDGDTLVGYIGSQYAGGQSDIMNLAIAPNYRRRGAARALLSLLEYVQKRRNSAAITLEVRESNSAAICLYENFGFHKIGVRPNYYFKPKEDALIYRKEMCYENSSN